jgi:hypothetical protein
VLNSEVLDLVVYSTVAETYIQHNNVLDYFTRDAALRRIGHIKMLIINLGIDFRYRPGFCPSTEDIQARNELLQRGKYLVELLNIPWLDTINLNVERDLFMEVLINNVRNEVTSFQAFLNKEKSTVIAEVISDLNTLKEQYAVNFETIRRLENALKNILDQDLRTELENYEWFEHISSEKMSPKFLDLAKQTKGASNLSDIKMPVFRRIKTEIIISGTTIGRSTVKPDLK